MRTHTRMPNRSSINSAIFLLTCVSLALYFNFFPAFSVTVPLRRARERVTGAYEQELFARPEDLSKAVDSQCKVAGGRHREQACARFCVSLCSGTSRPVEGMRQSSSSAAPASPSSLSPMRPDDAPSHRSSSSEAAASEFICFARSCTSGDRNRVSSFLLSCSCFACSAFRHI